MNLSEYEKSLDPSNWLSYFISKEKRRIRNIRHFQRILEGGRAVWRTKGVPLITSKWCGIFILFMFLLYYSFPIDLQLYRIAGIRTELPDFYLTLWQVHSTIIGIAFAIIIFFFESLSSRLPKAYQNLEHRFRQEFYERSAIMPLLFYNLFSIAYVGIIVAQSSRLLQGITLLVTSLLSICYLFAKALTFFQSASLEKTRLEIIDREINLSIEAEIDQRVSENLIYQLTEKTKYLEFSLLFRPVRVNLTTIDVFVDERRVITDINIGQILAIMERNNSKFFIFRGIGDTISPRDSVVGYAPEKLGKGAIESLKKCFKTRRVISKTDVDLAFDDLQNELSEAIERQNSRELSRIWDIYSKIVETFLQILRAYGITHSAKQAREAAAIRDWKPLARVQRDFYLAIERALKTKNREIIREIVNFPLIMLITAKNNLDHLVFRRFKGFFATLYLKSLEERKEVNKFVTYDILEGIQTYISAGLIFALQHDDLKKEEIAGYSSYLIESLSIYESLLKASMEKGETEDFRILGHSLDVILEHFRPDEVRPYLPEIEVRLKNPGLSSDERERWNQILEAKKEKIDLRKRAEKYIQQIWYGLGGWLTELFSDDRIKVVVFRDLFRQVADHFTDLKSFTSLFVDYINITDSSHDWIWWRIRSEPTPALFTAEVGEITSAWLKRFYCIQGARLTSNRTVSPDLIQPSLKLRHKFNPIKDMCERIKREMDKWSIVIAEGDAKQSCQKVDNLLENIALTVEKQKKIEDDWLISQPLSESKIAEFRKAVIEE